MTPTKGRQVRLKSRPNGIPQAENFEIAEAQIPSLRDGQFLVRNDYLSVEPAMRGWVSAVANYSTPVGIGEVMRSFAAGEVIASKHPQFAEGDWVMGMLGWPGDTVVVSTAAGAVGSAVGQIAKISGCRTVGIAGGPEKTRLCTEAFGYDAAIDSKRNKLDDALAADCPNGINVYFDNTAGAISDAVLRQLAVNARVVICGTASVPSWDPPPSGPRVERNLLVKRAQMTGFLIFDYQHRYEEAVARLADWVRAGRIRYREDISDGIEACPDAIAGLYRGENLGKRLIHFNHG